MKKIIKTITLISTIITVIATVASIIYFLEDLDIIDIESLTAIEDNTDITNISKIENEEIKNVMTMSDEEICQKLSGGAISQIPNNEALINTQNITDEVEKQIETITVPTWAWEDENDPNNLNKVTKNRNIQVNKLLSDIWIGFFTDLYNTDSNFVIVEGFYEGYKVDTNCSCQDGYKSAHTYGAAIDLNNSNEVGNPYGVEKPYTKQEWEKLPENQLKYQIIYKDSPIVKIAHKYTLLWGGELSGANQNTMHFSFVGDGKTREERIQLFAN